MKKDSDFDGTGKKTPYRVPEDFFDEVQRKMQRRTYTDKPTNRRLWIAALTGIAVAAVLVGFLLMPSYFRQSDPGGTDLQRPDTENYTTAIFANK